MNSYSGQVTGHGNIFTSSLATASGKLFKKLDSREYQFYRDVTSSKSNLQKIGPHFHGVYSSSGKESKKLMKLPLDQVDLITEPFRETRAEQFSKIYIMLDNVTSGMRLPCVMDVKLGRREYDPWCSVEKNRRLHDRVVHTTSLETSTRYCGHMAYVRASTFAPENEFQTVAAAGHGLWKVAESKYYGRKVRPDNIMRVFKKFFRYPELSVRTDVIEALLPRLYEILRLLREQTEYVFEAASLLVAYDAAVPPGEASQDSVRACVIDYEHAVAAPDSSGGDPDATDGVEHFINFVQQIYSDATHDAH